LLGYCWSRAAFLLEVLVESRPQALHLPSVLCSILRLPGRFLGRLRGLSRMRMKKAWMTDDRRRVGIHVFARRALGHRHHRVSSSRQQAPNSGKLVFEACEASSPPLSDETSGWLHPILDPSGVVSSDEGWTVTGPNRTGQ
jgi:hypothetical protein